ncbi:hypothetical protein [Arthrobacter sp. NA-172]|uniref:hypothetical protein n=1 Tax=Arthrobacter sp. NA-172 TaxID=3367524 RepID=UPI0037549375
MIQVDAERYMGGHGIMVWGINNGQLAGLSRTEDHQLQSRLEPYLTPDGPYWRGIRLPALSSDREILIIDVAPPLEGDPMYICHKDGAGVADGDVYVRYKTESRKARSADLNRLQARAKPRTPVPEIAASLTSPLYQVVDDPAHDEEYIRKIAQSLLRALPEKSSKSIHGWPSQQLGLADRTLIEAFATVQSTENRSPEQYRNQISEWSDKALNSLPRIKQLFLATSLPDAVIRIDNRSDKFIKSMQFDIHLSPGISAIQASEKELSLSDEMPGRPRRWGPTPTMPLGLGAFDTRALLRSTARIPNIRGNVSTHFQNGPSNVRVIVHIDELRPRQTVSTNARIAKLYLADGSTGSVSATWTATMADYDGVLRGEFMTSASGVFETSQMYGR